MGTGTARLRGASAGLGRLAAAITQGGGLEQQGYDASMANQTRMAQALAAIDRDRAAADRDMLATDMLRGRPQVMRDLIAANAGTDGRTLDAFEQKLRTGEMVTDFEPELSSRITQALTRFAPLAGNTGDLNPQQWAQALGSFREQDLGDDVLAGRRTAGEVGSSQAAVAGRPLFNSDANGAVLDLFGGALDTNNPMAGAAINLRNQQAGQARAAAAENYAQAAAARAAAADGANRAGAKAPTGYRWAADGKTLEAIPGGPADPNTKGAKLSRPPTEGQAKALIFAARMQLADEAFADLAQKGVERPGAIKGVAETAGNILGLGTDTLGGALSDVAGTLTNWTQSPEQQQVEQAQRDFINAVLRRESGAVISPGEFRNAAKQYFPQPNDDAATLARKAQARRAAIAGMKAEFGDSFASDFERILREARGGQKVEPEGTWDAPAAPPAPRGWNIVRER